MEGRRTLRLARSVVPLIESDPLLSFNQTRITTPQFPVFDLSAQKILFCPQMPLCVMSPLKVLNSYRLNPCGSVSLDFYIQENPIEGFDPGSARWISVPEECMVFLQLGDSLFEDIRSTFKTGD